MFIQVAPPSADEMDDPRVKLREGSAIKLMMMAPKIEPRELVSPTTKKTSKRPSKKPTRMPSRSLVNQTEKPNSGVPNKIAKTTNFLQKAVAAAAAAPKLIYYGGPVIANVKVITIWWGGVSNVKYTSKLEKF